MGKFITELTVTQVDEENWKLVKPLKYESNTLGLIEVPKGFITNFGSVRRWPIIYWMFGGKGNRACALHDWLYTSPHKPNRWANPTNRELSDCAFRGIVFECLRIEKPITIKEHLLNIKNICVAWLMWAGVRIGGSSHWK